LNELKQELDTDDHKVPIEELYRRLKTNATSVRYFLISSNDLNSLFTQSMF